MGSDVVGLVIDKGIVIEKISRAMNQEELDSKQASILTIAEQAADRLLGLEKEITALANEKVDTIIPPVEKPHWMGVSDALSRTHNLWLAEVQSAAQESRAPDEATYQPLTDNEHQVWFSLSLIQIATCAVREAAMVIRASLGNMTDEEINALSDDWAATHILWS